MAFFAFSHMVWMHISGAVPATALGKLEKVALYLYSCYTSSAEKLNENLVHLQFSRYKSYAT